MVDIPELHTDTIVVVHPSRFDHDPFHRIGLELQRLLADTLTQPLPGHLMTVLQRLDKIELKP